MLSIGPACRPAMNMRWNALRSFSSPLDWMMGYSLDTILHLFQCEFKDFFRYYHVDSEKNGATGKRWVEDIQNIIISIHHFPIECDVDVVYPEFKEKMLGRAKFLIEKIDSSERIILVGNRPETQNEILYFLESFSAMYPQKTVRLINIRQDDSLSYDEYRECVVADKSNISYVEYLVNDTDHGVFKPEGNTFVWSKVLSKYTTFYTDEIRKSWQNLRARSGQFVIYGAGIRCCRLLGYLLANGIKVDGIAVSSVSDNPEELFGVKIKQFSEYSKDSSMIISNMRAEDIASIRKTLERYGIKNIAYIDDNMRFFEDYGK